MRRPGKKVLRKVRPFVLVKEFARLRRSLVEILLALREREKVDALYVAHFDLDGPFAGVFPPTLEP